MFMLTTFDVSQSKSMLQMQWLPSVGNCSFRQQHTSLVLDFSGLVPRCRCSSARRILTPSLHSPPLLLVWLLYPHSARAQVQWLFAQCLSVLQLRGAEMAEFDPDADLLQMLLYY